jgi:hypothetical protein
MGKKNSDVGTDTQTTTEAPEAPVEATETPETSGVVEPDSPAETPVLAEAPEPAETAVAAPIDADELPEKDPGKMLGIVAIVGSLALGLIGLGLGFVSYRRSRAAGFGGGFGMGGMILGTITTVLLVLYFVLLATGMGFGGACDGLGPGVHTLDNGTRVSCQ